MDKALLFLQNRGDMSSLSPLWQAVYSAYETHDTNEARRLLYNEKQPPDCSHLLRCGNEDYIRWLLSNELLPLAEIDPAEWPELQEIQLQCSALDEAARPDCVLTGKIPCPIPEIHTAQVTQNT